MMELIGMLSVQVDMLANFNTITLIHNQEKNLAQLLESYSLQSIKPGTFIFVLDRCSDNSESIIREFSNSFNAVIIKNLNGSDFMAGYCRDLAYSKFPNLPAIFLDGDCIPSPDLFSEFSKEFFRNSNGIVLGSRKLESLTGEIQEDNRVRLPWLKGRIFNEHNTSISNTFFAKPGMLTWSCCLGITPFAANLISNINKTLTGNRRLFSSTFDGNYGGEDTFVGMISMLYNIPISSISTNHYVLHKWHESSKKEEYQHRIDNECEKLKELAVKTNAPGLHNIFIDYSKYVQDFVFSQMVKQ